MNSRHDPLTTRSALIGGIDITSIASAATFQVGDRHTSNATTRALAVQQKLDSAAQMEVDFSQFPFFQSTMPSIDTYVPPENNQFHRTLQQDKIQVGFVRILAASTAATVLAGNSSRYHADARVKHFRVLS
ncbi:spore germination protein GerPE [Paenibacillus yanchengensis]|uniref:Spore germination protein GerPE n=1 Tax=Paenibacillus yanchengensis TaxID=2035833 RepID=A0ABW4YKD0_9BACL